MGITENDRESIVPKIPTGIPGNVEDFPKLSLFGRPFVKWFTLCYWTVVCPVRSVCLSVTLMYCGQIVGCITMKLGMQVGLGPSHTVLDGDPAPLPKGEQPPSDFWPISIVAKWLNRSRCHLVGR